MRTSDSHLSAREAYILNVGEYSGVFVMRLVVPFAAALVAACVGVSVPAVAGGFEVREQSTFFQGMSFAGAAAQGDSITSMFWNPAAAGAAGEGLTSSTGVALILPRSDVEIETIGGFPVGAVTGLDPEVDIGREAVVPSSYYTLRVNDKLVLGMSINSQFGLGTKPDNTNWAGQLLAQTSELFSINATPTVSYEIASGVTVGGGLQIQYMDLKKLTTSSGLPGPSSSLSGDDYGFGFTLGVNFRPTKTTSIGIGYRSGIEHKLRGKLTSGLLPANVPISAKLTTPEKVTASFRQEVSNRMRFLGTVEWVNWSRMDRHAVIPVGPLAPFVPNTVLDFQWDNGWFFSLGAEYDVNEQLTVRFGGAYEISPIQDPTQRLVQVPDADRIWASVGASYKWSDWLNFDVAYSHVFVEDSHFVRVPASAPGPVHTGNVDSAVDIIALGVTMKFGGSPTPMK